LCYVPFFGLHLNGFFVPFFSPFLFPDEGKTPKSTRPTMLISGPTILGVPRELSPPPFCDLDRLSCTRLVEAISTHRRFSVSLANRSLPKEVSYEPERRHPVLDHVCFSFSHSYPPPAGRLRKALPQAKPGPTPQDHSVYIPPAGPIFSISPPQVMDASQDLAEPAWLGEPAVSLDRSSS